MFSNLVHLILNLSISYPYLIKFHDFVDNSQEGMKHQMRGATQAQQGMTLLITLINQQLPTSRLKLTYGLDEYQMCK
jgi:hypothetical protein